MVGDVLDPVQLPPDIDVGPSREADQVASGTDRDPDSSLLELPISSGKSASESVTYGPRKKNSLGL